jgi:Kef-type K+ transport system membrane component KefB
MRHDYGGSLAVILGCIRVTTGTIPVKSQNKGVSMSPTMQLALAMAVIITAAKVGGYISYRLGQPAVLGEILIGVILGPSVVDFLHLSMFTDSHLPETIHHLAEFGVLLLMFIAGLGLHLSDLAKSGTVSALAGSLGVAVPVGMGYVTARLFDFDNEASLFLGLILAATSVSISAQTLMELRVLRSRVGISMLGAAVFDDILVVLGLSIFIAVTADAGGASLTDVALIGLQMVLFMTGAIVLGFSLLSNRLTRIIHSLPVSEGLMAYVFVVMLMYGWAAEELGSMAAITGAFIAGLVFARSPLVNRIEERTSTLAYSVFVPIFFINIGLSANMRELTSESLLLMLVLVVVAVVSKVLGAGTGGWLAGLSHRESLQLGVGMMSRGEVGLIVATVGVNNGVVDAEMFAAVVGVVIITTLLTPPLLRILFADQTAASSKETMKGGVS